MTRHSNRLFVTLICLLCIGCSANAWPVDRPMTVNDMLAVEGTGTALADPAGRWIFYEQVRPYDQITDFSFRTYAYQKSGHQVWRYDLEKAAGPVLLPGLDQAPHTWLQEVSPSGRFLTLFQYSFGDLKLIAYDLEQETAVSFDPTPAFSRSGEHNPVWLSSDEVIYAALDEGDAPLATSVRAHTGKMLMSAWQDAWRGEIVTANEVRTRLENVPDEAENGRLVRANASTGAVDILAEGLFADIRVSPDGTLLAALSVSKPRRFRLDQRADTDPRSYRLVVFDLASGDAAYFASDLEFSPYSIAWAPDGQRLAAYGWQEGEDARSGRFHVIDTKSGAVTRYEHYGLDLASERERGWLQRPERTLFLGDMLVVFGRPIPKEEDQRPRFTFREYSERDLPRADWFALMPEGASRNLTGFLREVSAVPVHSGEEHFTVLAQDGLYRLWADGRSEPLIGPVPGVIRQMLPDTFATRAQVIRPDFGREGLFEVSVGEDRRLAVVSFNEDSVERALVVEMPSGDVTPLAASFEGKAVLLRKERGRESVLTIIQPESREGAIDLVRLNRHLSDIDLGEWRQVSYSVEDPEGILAPTILDSCVLLPPGFDEGTPVPLVVEVYPNARPRCETSAGRIEYPDPDSPYIWTGRGYAYARLTTPSSLIRTVEGPLAGMDEVVEAGVAALVEAGIADPERIVLTGFSQGGVSSLYVASQSDQFKAVIAINSWADLSSHYYGSNGILSYLYGLFGSFSTYESLEGTDFGVGYTPLENPEIFRRNSPVFLAQNINAPVMLVHTDMDAFPIYQFDEMYGALLRAGKDARYVRYWGEGHGLSSPANIRDLWDRIDVFLTDQGVSP